MERDGAYRRSRIDQRDWPSTRTQIQFPCCRYERSARLGSKDPLRPAHRHYIAEGTHARAYTVSTSCARGDTICPAPLLSMGTPVPRAPPSRCNVAVLSHADYVPTLTAAAALRGKAALSKSAWWPWPLTFWPWKWCPRHVWRGLPLCQF